MLSFSRPKLFSCSSHTFPVIYGFTAVNILSQELTACIVHSSISKNKEKEKEADPMQITATELKLNFGKYLNLVLTEDMWITRNGKMIAKMVNPNVPSVDAISGVLAFRGADHVA